MTERSVDNEIPPRWESTRPGYGRTSRTTTVIERVTVSVPAIKVMLWTEDPMAPVPSWINEPVLVSKVNPVGNAG